jgi:hypothetical protein
LLIVWTAAAVTFAAGIVAAQVILYRRFTVMQPPDFLVVKCANCGEGIHPTKDGWRHVKRGGGLCNSNAAKPPKHLFNRP